MKNNIPNTNGRKGETPKTSSTNKERILLRAHNGDNYLIFFRHYTRIMSKLEALFVQDIISLSDRTTSRRRTIDGKRCFLCMESYLLNGDIIWTEDEQRRHFASLKGKGYMEVFRKGSPPRRWVYINIVKLDEDVDAVIPDRGENHGKEGSYRGENHGNEEGENHGNLMNERITGMNEESTYVQPRSARLDVCSLEDIPDGSLSRDQIILLIEQQNAQEQESTNHRRTSPSNPKKIGESNTTPMSQQGSFPSHNGKDSSHGKPTKTIPKGRVGGRGMPHKGKGDDGKDQTTAARLARRHINIIECFRKLNKTPRRFPDFPAWVKEFRAMLEDDDQQEEDIESVLTWLSDPDNYENPYTADVLSASSFRDKFPKLWRAIGRKDKKEEMERKASKDSNRLRPDQTW